MMVIEYIRYRLADEKRREAFERAYEKAQQSLRASPHCQAYELSQCQDEPVCYVLRIEWDSREGHLERFRKSAEFRDFYQAVAPYVQDIEEMRHYTVTRVKARKS